MNFTNNSAKKAIARNQGEKSFSYMAAQINFTFQLSDILKKSIPMKDKLQQPHLNNDIFVSNGLQKT